MRHTLLFFISLLLVALTPVVAQEVEQVPDSTAYRQAYGLRVGVDLSKIARTLLEDGFTGFEIQGDFRVTDKMYAALELGNEERVWDEGKINSIATGSYAKVGVDFNAYNNWLGMNNAIFTGLRYGFSTFRQELVSYEVFITDQTIPAEVRTEPQEFTGLTASWAELIVGVKTEIFNNLYLSLNVQLKRKISETKPDNFDNLIIPGFNRTYDESEFGVGYGYTISYLIPIFKK